MYGICYLPFTANSTNINTKTIMKKKTKKVVSYKSLVNFVVSRLQRMGSDTLITLRYNGARIRGFTSNPSNVVLTADNGTVSFMPEYERQKTLDMNTNIILPQEAISPDSFFRALIELDPLGYRETLLLLTDP